MNRQIQTIPAENAQSCQGLPATAPVARPVLAVAGTFTADPLADVLRFWEARLPLPSVEVCQTPYGQVFRSLLDSASPLHSKAGGLNVILLRFADLVRDRDQTAGAHDLLGAGREFIDTVMASAERAHRPTLVLACPEPPGLAGRAGLRDAATSLLDELRHRAAGVVGLEVLDAEDIGALYTVADVHDATSDRLAHQPFTPEYWTALGTMVARRLRVCLQGPFKVIAVDADHTLWGGVVGEVGPAAVDLGGPYRALQAFLRRKREQGFVLVLLSKNREADVTAVFDRPDMTLRRDDFALWRVNWDPKSRNLIDAVSSLNLGLESVVFLDDNPLECAEVASRCPAVTAVCLPADPVQIPALLGHIWALDAGPATTADAQRTALYREQADRDASLAAAPSFRDFLASLALEVVIEPLAEHEVDRASQLTIRTNQFNATGIRRSPSEMRALLASNPAGIRVVRARDRFGDYGLIGLAIFALDATTLSVETMLMSCRALGKGIEHRLIAWLGQHALQHGAERIRIHFQSSARNEPIERFLSSVAAPTADGFELAAARAAGVVFDPDASSPAPTPDAGRHAAAVTTPPTHRVDFAGVAAELRDAAAIHRAVRAFVRPATTPSRTSMPAPEGSLEAGIAAIWEEVLQVRGVGLADRFRQLGGTSLSAVTVAARVSDRFDVDLPLVAALSDPSVAELAQAVRTAPPATPAPAPAPPAATALSSAQQRLIFLDGLISHRGAYNIAAAVRIRGHVDVAALQLALDDVIRRHAPLDAVVSIGNGGGGEPPRHQPSVPLRQTDAATERFDALAASEASQPFDLARERPVRALLATAAPDDHLLVLTVHHVVADGWSMGLIWREWSDAYAARRTGDAPDWQPLGSTYADYVAWETARRESGSVREGLEYFRKALSAVPAQVELPTDRPRPAQMSYSGGLARLALPVELRRSVEALARREGRTPFAVLMAAWQALVHRYTGQPDFAVGTAVAGRTRAAFEGLVGCFVNTVPVAAHVDGALTFRTHLSRVDAGISAALSHQEVPFERLVQELRVPRDLSRSPVVQQMLVFQDTPPGTFAIEDATVASVHVHNGGAKFDLVLEVTPDPGGYRLALEFSRDIYLAPTAERILRHFSRLLAHACETPDTTIADLPLMDTAEERATVALVNRRAIAAPAVTTLHASFERQAQATPDAGAVSLGDSTLTYQALDLRANRIAHALGAAGVRPGSRVAVCLDRTPDLIASILAVLKAGAAYVPIDPAYPADRQAFMLDDAGVQALVTERRVNLTCAPACPVLALDDDAPAIDAQPVTRPIVTSSADDLAYVIYTSGSTGRPKGCMVTHRNVSRLMTSTEPWFGFTADDVWTLFHSPAFDFSVWEIWGALLYGGRLVIVPHVVSRSPEAFHDLLVRERVTVLNQTPSAFRQLVRIDEGRPSDALSLRWVIFGGEALEMPALRGWFERHGDVTPRLVNMYGITETTVHVTFRLLSTADANGPSAIGVPIPDLRVYVLEANGRPAPIGVAGEMHVAGEGLARGYLNRPDLTATRFVTTSVCGVEERLYKSGDLARVLPDGELVYVGRADDQVKIRGFRIEPGEIVSALRAHPAVADAVVVAREDSPGDRRLVAYVVGRDGTVPDTSTLRTFLRGTLPDHMVPAAFVSIPAVPLTSSGKLDRRALPPPDQARPSLAAAFVVPASERERQVAAIWQSVLGLSSVGLHDNFFDLGGDSMRLALVLDRLKAIAPHVTLVDLFRYPTVSTLAAHLSRTNDEATGAGSTAATRGARQRALMAAQRRPIRGRA